MDYSFFHSLPASSTSFSSPTLCALFNSPPPPSPLLPFPSPHLPFPLFSFPFPLLLCLSPFSFLLLPLLSASTDPFPFPFLSFPIFPSQFSLSPFHLSLLLVCFFFVLLYKKHYNTDKITLKQDTFRYNVRGTKFYRYS